jgi:hypothetical protein
MAWFCYLFRSVPVSQIVAASEPNSTGSSDYHSTTSVFFREGFCGTTISLFLLIGENSGNHE